MPVDLVRGSVGTNSIQVIPINEVVASLTSTPIGLHTQPYARARTSYSPTFSGENDDNHKEEWESQGETREDSKSQGSDEESQSQRSDADSKSKGSDEDSKSQGSDEESQSQRSDADWKSNGSDADSKSKGSDVDSKSKGSDEESQSEGSDAASKSQASDEESKSQASDEPSDGNASKEDETLLGNTENLCSCGCGNVPGTTHCCSNTGKKVTTRCYDPRQDMDEKDDNKGVCKGCYPEMEASYCCCGCRYIASNTKHKCLHTGKHVRPYCYKDGKTPNLNLNFFCQGCHNKLAPEDGTPTRSALQKKSKEAMIVQGERMRKYAQQRSNGNKEGPLTVGTVVRVKVDKADRGKLDHKSVPGVIVEVTEHNNYRIVCKGGTLKECLGAQRFQGERLKKPEHYNLDEPFSNWQFMRKISIREALTFISKMGGQGFFFCNCKGKCNKNNCKCRKKFRQCNSKCHPQNTNCLNAS